MENKNGPYNGYAQKTCFSYMGITIIIAVAL